MTDGGVDFGRDGSARYVGAFPGRDLRCAEERGSGCLPRHCANPYYRLVNLTVVHGSSVMAIGLSLRNFSA